MIKEQKWETDMCCYETSGSDMKEHRNKGAEFKVKCIR